MQTWTMTSHQVKRANKFELKFVTKATDFVVWHMHTQVF